MKDYNAERDCGIAGLPSTFAPTSPPSPPASGGEGTGVRGGVQATVCSNPSPPKGGRGGKVGWLAIAVALCTIAPQASAQPAQNGVKPSVSKPQTPATWDQDAVNARAVEQRYGFQFQQLYRSELHFMRQACLPTREQFEKIAAEGEAGMQEAMRLLGQRQYWTQAATPSPSHPREAIADALVKSARKNLSSDQATRYEKELASRAEALKKSSIAILVARIDRHLYLDAKQRQEFEQFLGKHWDSLRAHSDLIAREQYLPPLPNSKFLPILSLSQNSIWEQIPRSASNYGDIGFLRDIDVDEELWDGKPALIAFKKPVPPNAPPIEAVGRVEQLLQAQNEVIGNRLVDLAELQRRQLLVLQAQLAQQEARQEQLLALKALGVQERFEALALRNAIDEIRVPIAINENALQSKVRWDLNNPAPLRARMNQVLALYIDDYDRTCKLSPAQERKLQLMGRGDIRRYFEQCESFKESIQEMPPQEAPNLQRQVQQLRKLAENGIFDSTSLFRRSIPNTLTAEQLAKYEAAVRDCLLFRHQAAIKLVVADVDRSSPLSAASRQAFLAMLDKETKPARKFGQFDQDHVLWQLAQIPENQLRPLFDGAQWRAVNRNRERGKQALAQLRDAGYFANDAPTK